MWIEYKQARRGLVEYWYCLVLVSPTRSRVMKCNYNIAEKVKEFEKFCKDEMQLRWSPGQRKLISDPNCIFPIDAHFNSTFTFQYWCIFQFYVHFPYWRIFQFYFNFPCWCTFQFNFHFPYWCIFQLYFHFPYWRMF